jgi:SHS2 domain-containing protein
MRTDPSGAILTLETEGHSLPQLFENAGRELLKTFIDPEDVGEVLREKIIVEAADAPALLRAWIDALLSLAGQQHLLMKSCRFQIFDVERTGAGKLRAEVTGELVDPLRHRFRKELAGFRCREVRLINDSSAIKAQVMLHNPQ